MKKIVKIGDKEVSIRGVKLREIKEFASGIEGKAEEIFKIAEGENVIKNMYAYMLSQMDELTAVIEVFSDMKKEDIEDLEMTELVELGEHLLHINGIDKEKMESFFIKAVQMIKDLTNPRPVQAEAPTFVEAIPKAAC